MENSVQTKIDLRPPYLLFIGDVEEEAYTKTGAGLAQWRPELCKGQLRLTKRAADLGLADMNVEEAVAAGVRSLVVGTASVGGGMPSEWLDTFARAARAGLDIVSGLHVRLSEIPALRDAAQAGDARLVDIRRPPDALPIGTGRKRSGLRVLTVGTDCALGKKYTALQLEKDMRAAGLKADFRATGQTGIMIAGGGLPIDAVVSDFIVGAAELISPDNDADHWDVVEGQGGIFHPAYAPVSHGLLLGSQPDAIVVCHAAGRKTISGWPDFPTPSIGEVITRTIEIGALVNPRIKCVGISVNSSSIPQEERASYLSDLSAQYSLPCADPLIDGMSSIVEKLNAIEPSA